MTDPERQATTLIGLTPKVQASFAAAVKRIAGHKPNNLTRVDGEKVIYAYRVFFYVFREHLLGREFQIDDNGRLKPHELMVGLRAKPDPFFVWQFISYVLEYSGLEGFLKLDRKNQ